MVKPKNDLLVDFLKKEYNFCWENQKVNYETREKLLRIYITVLSILPALIMVLFKFGEQNSNQYCILIVTLLIVFIFGLLTWKRNISLHISIIRFRKQMNNIKERLLKMVEPDEEDEREKILNEIPYNPEIKYRNSESGDIWLIIALEILTILTLFLIIWFFIEILYDYQILLDNRSCFRVTGFLFCIVIFIVLHNYMLNFFDRKDNEEKDD